MTRTWRITYRPFAGPGCPLIEDVDADDCVIERDQWVLYRDGLVMLTPRRVVVRRLQARDVLSVTHPA